METRKCIICGAEYMPTKPNSMYCSRRCSSKAWRNRSYPYTYLNCQVCGKEYKRIQSRQKYCSKECRQKAELVRLSKRNSGAGKHWSLGLIFVVHQPNRLCHQCGQPFFKRPCYISRGNILSFCTNDCRIRYMATHPEYFPHNNNIKRSKSGKRQDLNDIFFRSSWEANYARYLNWLISLGEINRWEFEPDTYEFPVKRGSKFYTPDFKVFNNDGSFEYHEIKGYMDQRSQTKLNRMKKYYPEIKLLLVDSDQYHALARDIKNVIPNWETY